MTESFKIVCQKCYDVFRAAQEGKDICQYCWLPIEDEEAESKLRFKVRYLQFGYGKQFLYLAVKSILLCRKRSHICAILLFSAN